MIAECGARGPRGLRTEAASSLASAVRTAEDRGCEVPAAGEGQGL